MIRRLEEAVNFLMPRTPIFLWFTTSWAARTQRKHHHEPQRSRADPAVEGKARRDRSEDFSDNLVVQLSVATEALNRTSEYRARDLRRPALGPASGRRPLADSSTTSRPCSRPSSCCRGCSRKRRRPNSTRPSSSTTCGSPTPAPPPTRSSLADDALSSVLPAPLFLVRIAQAHANAAAVLRNKD